MPPIDDDDHDRPRSDNDDGESDRPRKRRRRDDDDDYEWEQRKKKSGGGVNGAMIAIIVIVVGILGCGGVALLVGLLLPAVTKVREAASRTQELNNMKQVSLGILNYQSSNINLPRADDKLSWRIHILPYIEQDALHRQVDLDAAWDQGRNASLASVSIPTYMSNLDEPPTSQTHYRVFTGTGTVFDTNLWKGKGPFPVFVQDGISNTLLAIDTAETVPWPQPKEVPFTQNGSFPEFGHPKRQQVLTAFCDGSVRAIEKKQLSAEKLRPLITAAGGEAVPMDW